MFDSPDLFECDVSSRQISGRFWYAADWANITTGRCVHKNVVTYHPLARWYNKKIRRVIIPGMAWPRTDLGFIGEK